MPDTVRSLPLVSELPVPLSEEDDFDSILIGIADGTACHVLRIGQAVDIASDSSQLERLRKAVVQGARMRIARFLNPPDDPRLEDVDTLSDSDPRVLTNASIGHWWRVLRALEEGKEPLVGGASGVTIPLS